MEPQIDKIFKEITHTPKEADKLTEAAVQDYSKSYEYMVQKVRQERHSSEILEEQVKALKDDREARKSYGKWVFFFVASYLSAILVIFCFSHLTENEKIALLGSTNINVIGLLFAVIRYLFPRRDEKKS